MDEFSTYHESFAVRVHVFLLDLDGIRWYSEPSTHGIDREGTRKGIVHVSMTGVMVANQTLDKAFGFLPFVFVVREQMIGEDARAIRPMKFFVKGNVPHRDNLHEIRVVFAGVLRGDGLDPMAYLIGFVLKRNR